MTDKRFTLKEHLINEYGLCDKDTEIAYVSHKSAFTIVELLNALHDENIRLRKPLKFANDVVEVLRFEINELKKENEQLKCKIELLENSIDMLKGEKEKFE